MTSIVPNYVRNAILKRIADAPGAEQLSVADREWLYADMLLIHDRTGEIADIHVTPSTGNAEYREQPETD